MAKSIMIQGTSSGVGKTILTIGLCRIFHEDGYKVAPFKAQNISNNEHKLKNGFEMARSQALCAIACGIEPSFHMNPVLIKPAPNTTEVIVNGKLLGKLDYENYKPLKDMLNLEITKSYEFLNENYEILVIEGAGSPVEMNLKSSDIVNMAMAKKAKSPVILVSDILRGGVFASLYGTLMLLDEDERDLVKGIIINKFKGDILHFKDGKDMIEKITDVPVLGVIPHLDICIEDEDSLTDGYEIKTKDSIIKKITGTYEEYLEEQFDTLSKLFRKYLDMDSIYKIMEGKIYG